MESGTMRAVTNAEPISVRARWTFLWCLLPVALFLSCGPTEPVGPVPNSTATPIAEVVEDAQEMVKSPPPPPPVVVLPTGFSPSQIEVLPLTELTVPADGQQGTQLNVYVSLLDVYNEKIKAPGTLRFELYEYVQRSAEPKGQRIAIWPDVDLNHPVENQRYWRDFLRAYEFSLGTQASRSKTYILEVTCRCPSGKRLSAEWSLKPEN